MKNEISNETLMVLKDLENRIKQFIEVNQLFEQNSKDLVKHQEAAFKSVLLLINQLIKSGAINRSVPRINQETREPIPMMEDMVVLNKYNPQEHLNLN